MSKVALRLLQMCGLPGPEVVGTGKWPEAQVWGLRHHSFPFVSAPSSDLHTPIPTSQTPPPAFSAHWSLPLPFIGSAL